ncbi:hypothetical protein L210DRAFT_3523048 [Boletus edulis BED1]|uniref:Heterokaryon incompatibility domain-containing protein n=1 Tax=Boletus edulis BED1 TaxID=1328754 RepID=A0AAD4GJV8_BOLED|nr:hypothetical protein L210DRAFT_3523048 [Boletus edulis BED1]
MTIPEVLGIFEEYTSKEIPLRFIDLESLCLVDIDTVRNAHRAIIESIEEADIERHTSYANQRREDVIRTIVKGVVKYAILSHTRQDQDWFGYRDMVSNAPLARTRPGWHKLERFCDIAKTSFRCRSAWTDIVCIDYGNRSDIETATQSLFDWYRNAYVCIVHLATASDPSDMSFTLPELLAPMRMKFYCGAGWKALNNDYIENDKADGSFLELLSKASGIPADDLRTFWPGPDRIRLKLSWASRRDTTTVEDKAYSLMAIFDSRIPIHYGEGEKAFIRLMVDVIPRSGECDVFAWQDHAHMTICLPPSPAAWNKHRDDHLIRLHIVIVCGDRSLSIDLHHVRMKVIILEIGLPPEGFLSYKPVPLGHSTLVDVDEMALGVIDYDWTRSPDKGILYKGRRYFCFLLYKTCPNTNAWQWIFTEKVVVFLTNGELLHIWI